MSANLRNMFTKTTCLLLLAGACLHAGAQRHTLLIHELMPDPQPTQGLPEAEYVELRNIGRAPIALAGWRLQAQGNTSGPFPAYNLQPDSFVVITGRTNASRFGPNTLGVPAFPALPNTGGLLVLHQPSGATGHALAYNIEWYQNSVKAQGGWSLEMVDAENTCGGAANWKASVAPAGGTPGSANSVAAPNPDNTPPQLLSAIADGTSGLVLQFSEPMDSSSITNTAGFTSEPALSIASAMALPPLFDRVRLQTASPLQPGVVYTVTAKSSSDCAGNLIGLHNKVPAGLPQAAVTGDLVINEVLFNPKDEGSDYVELYNRSSKIIDAAQLWLAKRGSNGNFDPPLVAAAEPVYLFPGGYLVLTEDPEGLRRQYLAKTPGNLLRSRLPSLPDDKGNLAVLNRDGTVIDELAYADNWHFALLANPEGVALERIDPELPTQQPTNWTSAAASAGFGTPGYRNSQFKQVPAAAAAIDIAPKVFSPDNDGFDDFCTISYNLSAPNFVANVFVFDATGRRVRHLVQNQTLTQIGFWRWDGLDDNRRALPSGNYVVLVESFHLEGKRIQVKKTVALARRH